MSFPVPSGPCANCNIRPATGFWVGTGSTLDMVHGHYSFWCNICMLEAQLEYAKERATAVSDLEKELSEAIAAEAP